MSRSARKNVKAAKVKAGMEQRTKQKNNVEEMVLSAIRAIIATEKDMNQ